MDGLSVKRSPTGSYIWTFGPQLEELFWKIVEPSEGGGCLAGVSGSLGSSLQVLQPGPFPMGSL